MDQTTLLWEGKHHEVYENPGNISQVIKISKNNPESLSWKQVCNSRAFFEFHFSDFIPKIYTLEQDTESGYKSTQERIQNPKYISTILGTDHQDDILEQLSVFVLRAERILLQTSMAFDISGTSHKKSEEDSISKIENMTNFLVGSTTESPDQTRLFFVDTFASSHSLGWYPRLCALLSRRRRTELEKRKDYLSKLKTEIQSLKQ